MYIHPGDMKSLQKSEICFIVFIAAWFATATVWYGTQSSVSGDWINRILYVYINECCSAKQNIKSCHLEHNVWNWKTLQKDNLCMCSPLYKGDKSKVKKIKLDLNIEWLLKTSKGGRYRKVLVKKKGGNWVYSINCEKYTNRKC